MVAFTSHAMQHGGLAVADFISHPLDHFHDFQSFISLRHKMTTHQLHKPIINRVDFLKQIALCLPQVATCIDESEFGNVHLEVGAVRKATQNAMAELDFATVREHLHLIADLFDRANAELYSAIRISYLEALFLGEISVPHLEARSMLSNFMENMLRQAELDLDRDCV